MKTPIKDKKRTHEISVSVKGDQQAMENFKKAIIEYQGKGWVLDSHMQITQDGWYVQKIYKEDK